MRSLRSWLAVVALAIVGVTAHAQDKTSFLGEDEFSTAPGLEGCDVLSMRENAKVKIGGGAKLRYSWASVNAANGTFGPPGGAAIAGGDPNGASSYHSSSWESRGIVLNFEIIPAACDENLALKIRLDTDDEWYAGGNYGQDEILREAYFVTKNLFGTGLGANIGKQRGPFGYDKDVLLVAPYLDGGSKTSRLRGDRNGGTANGNANEWFENNFYGFRGTTTDPGKVEFRWDPNRPTKYDRVFAFAPFYKVNDSVLLEAAVFQSRENNGRLNGTAADPRRHTNDPGLSFVTRATWTPISDLKIMASGVAIKNRYYADVRDIPYFYASSLAFDYTKTICDHKVNVFAEWERGWEPAFIDGLYTHDIHTGVSVGLTKAWTAFAQYEWLYGKTNITADIRQRLHRAVAALQYKFAESGLIWEAGFQREWGYYKANNIGAIYNGKNSAYADMVYTGLNWSF